MPELTSADAFPPTTIIMKNPPRHRIKFTWLALVLFLGGHSALRALPVIYLIGDSTVANWSSGYFPKEGWGQVLPYYFDSTKVTVSNKAVSGTSSKSFYDNDWAAVKALLKAGDYVFIQFGINDSASDTARHTDPETTFKTYLTSFCNETAAKGAYPVLVSTLNRCSWNSDGVTIYPAYHQYPIATRELAASINVPLIDLDKMCTARLQALGMNYSTNILYMTFPAGLWSNYTNGSADTVHLQLAGATEMARLVVGGTSGITANTNANVKKLIPFIKPTYKVNMSSNNDADGIYTRQNYYPAGVTVEIMAIPNSGHTFLNWTGNVNSTNRATTFTMGTATLSIHANFQ